MKHLTAAVLLLLLLAARRADAETDPPDHSLGLLFGVSGGVYGTVGGDLAASGLVTAEVGYRMPMVERAFGLSFAPTFVPLHPAHGTTKNAFAFAFPLLVSINFTLGPGLFRAAGGPLVAYAQVTSVDTFATLQDRGVGFGVEGFAAYLWKLPFGAVGVQVTYRLLPYVVARTAHTADIFSGEAAYVVGL